MHIQLHIRMHTHHCSEGFSGEAFREVVFCRCVCVRECVCVYMYIYNNL